MMDPRHAILFEPVTIGPTFVRTGDGSLAGVNWVFNGWGGQEWSSWGKDAKIASTVCRAAGLASIDSPPTNEGGGIHVDGEGTVLLTRTVQLDPGRNPGWTGEAVEEELQRTLGVHRFVWLDRGLTRDYEEFGTRGHVDIVACFSSPGTVLFHDQQDPAHPDHAVSRAVRERLESVGGLRLIPVPAPDVLRDDEGWVDYS